MMKHRFVLAFIFPLWSLLSIHLQSQTLHALIFADTKDATVGFGCTRAYGTMTDVALDISKRTGLTLKKYYLKDDDFKVGTAKSTISSLSCTSSDVILFFYSGHGYNRNSADLPTLVFRGVGESYTSRSLDLKWVVDELKYKSPRLLFVLNQSCNKVPESGTSREGDDLNAVAPPFEVSNERYRELFLSTKGSVVMTSSQRGQYSYINGQGGFFLLAFLEAYYGQVKSSNSKADWHSIKSGVVSLTQRIASNESKEQTPFCSVSVSGGYTPPPPPCSTCQGDGYYFSDVRCSNCSGGGTIYSTKHCSGCGGDGNVQSTCTGCSGTGGYSYDCNQCNNGVANFYCTNCTGTGAVICLTCGGSGRTLYYGTVYNCSSCGGYGKFRCGACNGNAQTIGACTYCGGAGKYTNLCTSCGGAGQRNSTHSACGGSGTVNSRIACSTCDGDGQVRKKYTCNKH